jgi:hypothetical protein
MQIVYDVPEGQYTQVPNSLIACPHLTPAHKVTWMQLASVCRNGQSHVTHNSIAKVAKALDLDYTNFRTAVNRLAKAGGIVKEQGDWRLAVPSDSAPEPTIEDEVQEAPNRKHSMTQKEAWELIKQGWNKEKPEAWMRLDGALNLPVYIAFETHAKRLEIEREQYADFAGQICRGGGAEEWWCKQTMKASSVFGFGKVADKKFENVEKLYKLGAKVEKKVDYQDDAEVFARYAVYGYTRSKIERIQVKDYDEAAKIAVDHNPEDTFVLYFAPNRDKPVFWTGIYTDRTRYLFS